MGEKITITINRGDFNPKPPTFLHREKCRQRARGYAHQSRCQTSSGSYWSVEGAAGFIYIRTRRRHAWRGLASSRFYVVGEKRSFRSFILPGPSTYRPGDEEPPVPPLVSPCFKRAMYNYTNVTERLRFFMYSFYWVLTFTTKQYKSFSILNVVLSVVVFFILKLQSLL